MNFKMTSITFGLSLAGLLSSCATVAPGTLVEARDAYARSSTGLAARLTPTELYDARNVLEKANQEFESKGDTERVRDYAYIAKLKIELADVKARTELDRQSIAEAAKQGVVVRDEQVKDSQDALAATREQLKDERSSSDARARDLKAANAAQGKELAATTERLEAERLGRQSADAKLAAAMKDLATIAAVKEDQRGLVITLSSSVLFASGKFVLLETAKVKLDQVAAALREQDPNKRTVVEGHTDSMGSDATNQPLSLNRANAVRDYLVAVGVSSGKISAVGLGSTRPIFSNSSAENRASNRRVEIVIQPLPITAR